MDLANFNPEDEMIKKMITESYPQEGFDLNIEDQILEQVYLSKEKLNEIAILKRKAKICLGITFGFLVIYALSCIKMFAKSSGIVAEFSNNTATLISFVLVGLFLVFYQLIYLLNNNSLSQKSFK